MVETIENAIIPEPGAEAPPGTSESDDAAIETQLTQEISTLWSDHVRLSTSRKATAKELRQIRAILAERLHAMKSLLARPGRGGQWRSWLRERGIPRSTADRLCDRHAETVSTWNNVPTGAIPEPTEADVERLFDSVYSHLVKRLTTPWSAYQFARLFVGTFNLPHEERENGLLVLDPGTRLYGPIVAPTPSEPVTVAGDGNSGEAIL
jgi:hypothetical protein